MLRVINNAASQNICLTNLAVRNADYKLAEQIACLSLKQEAGKKQHTLSQKGRLVKPVSL
jgi:hypothetical protein